MDLQFGLALYQAENNFLNTVQSDGLIATTFIIEPFSMDNENATDESDKLAIHNKLDEVKLQIVKTSIDIFGTQNLHIISMDVCKI